MIRSSIAFAVAALSLTSAAVAPTHAQAPAAPKLTRVEGVVQSISDSQIVLTKADGSTATVPLVADWSAGTTQPISVEQIQQGSYLGTTNYAKPDGTGTSLEVHVWPMGKTGKGVDFVMDAGAGTTMTNGIVGTVTQSASGRVLSVDYGHGVRVITVPPGVPVILNSPADRTVVKPGVPVMVTNFSRPTGDLQMVSVELK